jgi:hypothetical protein
VHYFYSCAVYYCKASVLFLAHRVQFNQRAQSAPHMPHARMYHEKMAVVRLQKIWKNKLEPSVCSCIIHYFNTFDTSSRISLKQTTGSIDLKLQRAGQLFLRSVTMYHSFVAANGLFGLNRAPVFCRRNMRMECEDEVERQACVHCNRQTGLHLMLSHLSPEPRHIRYDLGRNCSLLM